jgi:solute:Na+ symporter, SSS family
VGHRDQPDWALPGLYHRARLYSEPDFLLYGRQAGFVVLYLTVVASFHSAFAFLGSGGFFYTHGIGFWAAGAWTLLVGAITYVLGTRIWALGKAFGYITPADMLADFYESEAVRVAVAVVSVVFTILYIQVQAQGLGYIINVASDGRVTQNLGTLVLLVVAAIYLMAGGLRAVYWVGAIVLSYELFGGPLELWRQVVAQRPDLLTLPGPKGFFTPGMWVGMSIMLSFGIILQPHMMIRFYTAVDAKTIKLLGATTPIYLMSLYIPAALVGLGGAIVMPGLVGAEADRIFPLLLFEYANPWLTGVILAGATAAAMSTLDSILHANMTVLTRDVYQRYIAPEESQSHYVWVGRGIVMGLLVVGYFLSVVKLNFLVVLVTLSGAGALQLMPAILGVCFPGGHTLSRSGVVWGILAGLVTLYVTLWLTPHPLGMHGGLWGLLVNTAVAIGVSIFTEKPSRETIDRVHGEIEKFVYGTGE